MNTETIVNRNEITPIPEGIVGEEWLKENSIEFQKLMTYYNCALMETETKFKVINEAFKLMGDHNPIDKIETRLKKTENILEKLDRRNLPYSIEAIEQNIFDIAGIRVICAFESDIYKLADAFMKQDDIQVIERKDYIAEPKRNGYRSLHLLIRLPIFLYNEKKFMNVEVQFRTLAMDAWACLEHKIKYKKNAEISDDINYNLSECARLSAMFDKRMEEAYKMVGLRSQL
ncbi:MAG: GTP pyrophosphokinase family protein [Clostridia bacterium]|nr:GTP pyrophosphokinase family protein [Clostridia bacterium]